MHVQYPQQGTVDVDWSATSSKGLFSPYSVSYDYQPYRASCIYACKTVNIDPSAYVLLVRLRMGIRIQSALLWLVQSPSQA